MTPTSSSTVEKILRSAQVIQKGHFVFASGQHANLKVEIDQLWESPLELEKILELLCKKITPLAPELLIGVPTGGQRLAEKLAGGDYLDIPLAKLARIEGGRKQDFKFADTSSMGKALRASNICIVEDVVSTLSSVAGVVKLLSKHHQNITVVAIWRRNEVWPEYQKGISSQHYLIEKPLPIFPAENCKVCHPENF